MGLKIKNGVFGKNKSRGSGQLPEASLSPLAFVFAAILFVDGTIYALITFAAAILHELGHLAAALFLRAPISRISILPLGAVIYLGEMCPYIKEIAIKLAGCASNLMCAGAAAILRRAFAFSGAADVSAVYFIVCSLALAAFSLLPIRTLDGGEALYSLLCLWRSPDAAERAVKFTSAIALVLLWIFAGYLLFYTGGNFTLMLLCGWLFFAAVLQSGCR